MTGHLFGVPGWAILLTVVSMVLLAAWWALDEDAENHPHDEPYDWAAEGDFDDQG